jgi:hypothetical protein
MRSPIFNFFGVTEASSDADLSILKTRLEKALAESTKPIKFTLNEELLILDLTDHDFRFYIFFAKNEQQIKVFTIPSAPSLPFGIAFSAKPDSQNIIHFLISPKQKDALLS